MRTVFLVCASLLVVLWTRDAAAQLADSTASVTIEAYPYAKIGNDPRSQIALTVFRAKVGYPISLADRR